MKCFRLDLQNRHFSHKNFVSFFHISLDTTGYNISRKRFQLSTNVTVARSDYIFCFRQFWIYRFFFVLFAALLFNHIFMFHITLPFFNVACISFFLLFHFGAVSLSSLSVNPIYPSERRPFSSIFPLFVLFCCFCHVVVRWANLSHSIRSIHRPMK